MDDFASWLKIGMERGWVSGPVCATHEGLPSTDEEDAEWDAGFDPCVGALRIYPQD